MEKRVCSILLAILIAAALAACSSETTPEEQAALQQQFEESMRNVVLDGYFTTRNNPGNLRNERYTVEKATHLGGDLWTIHARIQYGEHDVTLPVPVAVRWAGDTPVISLTDATLPGLGTFTARVLIYRDHYAGFWEHGENGGNQFGRILHEGDPGYEQEEPPAEP